MNRKGRRTLKKKHQATLHQYSISLVPITEDEYFQKTGKKFKENIISVYVSRYFFVQVYQDPLCKRISVNRNRLSNAGNWDQNISWEELQDVKNQVGFSTHDCVEIYPAERDEVNVSNMRHLWVMEEPLTFAWRKAKIEEANKKEAEDTDENSNNT